MHPVSDRDLPLPPRRSLAAEWITWTCLFGGTLYLLRVAAALAPDRVATEASYEMVRWHAGLAIAGRRSL